MKNFYTTRYFLFRVKIKIELIVYNIISFFLTIFFIIPAFFLRILKYFIHIRIGCIRNDVIGESVYNADYYLSEKKKQKKKTLDIFYFQEMNLIINKQLIKMLQDKFRIFFLFRYLDYASSLLYDSSEFKVDFGNGRDLNGNLYFSGPNFNFDNNENQNGLNFLRKIGFDIDKDKFICLTIRDDGYKKKVFTHEFMNPKFWDYHNFRNANIENYYDVSKELLNKGYWVIRMGKFTNKKMNINHSKFIDYSFSEYRDDFLDIWLMANCFFTISNSTGIDEVAKIFRKPIVFTDMAYYFVPNLNLHSLTCFKKMTYKKSKKLISLAEIIKKNYIELDKTNLFLENGIELIDNSPKEIMETVLEMEKNLTYELNQSKETLELNEKFLKIYKTWKNYEKHHGFIHPKASISTSFLSQNKDWFLS